MATMKDTTTLTILFVIFFPLTESGQNLVGRQSETQKKLAIALHGYCSLSKKKVETYKDRLVMFQESLVVQNSLKLRCDTWVSGLQHYVTHKTACWEVCGRKTQITSGNQMGEKEESFHREDTMETCR